MCAVAPSYLNRELLTRVYDCLLRVVEVFTNPLRSELAPVTTINQLTISVPLYNVLKTCIPPLKSTFYCGPLDVL